jgi:hypothetical protein
MISSVTVHQSEAGEEPWSYGVAMQSGKATLWQEAMYKELESISDTGTLKSRFQEGPAW